MSTVLTTEITEILTENLGRAPTADEILAAETDALILGQVHNHLNVGLNEITIDSTINIQDVLDDFATDGGGKLNLLAGTYVLTEDLIIPSNVTIIGQSSANTILYCDTFNVKIQGTNVYDTGTVTAASGVTVTGSGTSWLANVSAGQSIFIGTRWYEIAAVAADDTIILNEAYANDVTFPLIYRAASIIGNVRLEHIQFLLSSSIGLEIKDCRRLHLEDQVFILNNIGMTLENISEVSLYLIGSFASTSDGIQATNVGLGDWASVNVNGNGGDGLVLYNVEKVLISPCDAEANGGNGISITECVQMDILTSASGNGGNGIECISDCDNLNLYNGSANGNVSDGIKLSLTTDNSKIYAFNAAGNGGYGINIVDANCDTNVITTSIFAGNGSGAVNDSGTGTIIRSNVGQADN